MRGRAVPEIHVTEQFGYMTSAIALSAMSAVTFLYGLSLLFSGMDGAWTVAAAAGIGPAGILLMHAVRSVGIGYFMVVAMVPSVCVAAMVAHGVVRFT